MNFEQVKELIQLVNESDLSYFEVKSEDSYVKMDKSLYRNSEITNTAVENKSLQSDDKDIVKKEQTEKLETSAQVEVAPAKEEEAEFINSPMVGTFYKAISPEADPFVNVGQKVSKGQVLCIVEAMKLMNEIVADFDCEIVSIEAQNGQMVEYGQPMFKIRR